MENNGYSKVESSAPDMENSSVIANLDPQVEEKIVAPIEKKTAARKAPAKKPCAKKAPVKKAEEAEKDGFVRVGLGEGMPYYLL